MEKNSHLPLEEIMTALSDLKNGKFSTLQASSDETLNPLIEKINELSISLKAKTQAQAISRDDNFLSNVLASLPCLVSYMDRDLNYLYVNDAYERWFGQSREKCLNSNMRDIVGHAGIEAVKPHLDAACQGIPQEFESEVPFKFGGKKIIHVQYIPDLAQNGKVKGITVIVNDITLARERELEFKSIFSNSPLGIIRLNSEYRILAANPAFETFLGYSELELKSKTIMDLTHPEDLEVTLKLIDSFPKESGLLHRFEKRYIHKSGNTVWGLVTSKALRNKDGKLSFLSNIEDITPLKESEIETATFFETIAEGIVVQDKNGVIEKFNPAAIGLLGLSEDQLLGRTSLDPRWKAIKEDGSEFKGEEHPAMVAIRTGKPVKGTLMGLTQADGSLVWIKINAVPYQSNDQLKVICTFSDVTEVVNARSEIRFILDALKIGVWKFNPTDQSLHWDKSMYQLFDVKESDFTGHYQAWESTLTPESKEVAVKELGQALSGEKEFDTVFEIQTRSKEKRFISGRGKVIRDGSGNAIMMYGVNTDVTDNKRLEAELQTERMKSIRSAKLASLGEMSAGVAHEINNPLAIIAGSAALLRKYQQHPEKFEDKIKAILKSCDRISKIVSGLKKFSRSGDKPGRKFF